MQTQPDSVLLSDLPDEHEYPKKALPDAGEVEVELQYIPLKVDPDGHE
ncbi:MAG TPA: hypothetical protein VIH79_03075 [Candidatus Nanopelagicaceae bacterium]